MPTRWDGERGGGELTTVPEDGDIGEVGEGGEGDGKTTMRKV